MLDHRVTAYLADTCVFFQPWWLEAVAPGQWDVAVAWRGEEVAGVWPYAYKIRLGRYRLLEHPELSFYLGPWIRSSIGRADRRLSEEKVLMTELHDALPAFASFQQWFHPRVTNWMPLQWKGFSQTTRYTYIFPVSEDREALWAGARESVRRAIRKARKELEVVEHEDVQAFLELQKRTFSSQGMRLPFSAAALERLDSAAAEHGVRKILCAVDSAGRVHAGAYVVWDATTVYFLLRGSDPDLRRSGAASLIAWAAIELASSQGKAFDFIGSWEEHIERFVRAFGGHQTPFFEVTKMNSRVVRGYRSLWKLTHPHG